MAPSITLSIVGLICAAVGNAALNGPQVTAAPALLRGRVVNAIDPTSAGQIGVNPVTSDLGDPFSYVLTKLGTANPVVTWDGSVYHYIEGHTDYLTIETITTTVDNSPSTTTSSVKVAVQTATGGSDTGQEAGAIGITFSKDIADNLRKTAEAALQNCAIAIARRSLSERIDSTSCLIEAAITASGEGGPLEGAASDAFWESVKAEIAANASSTLKNAIAVIQSQAQKKKAIIILSALMAAMALMSAGSQDNPVAVVNIPATGVGSPPNKPNTCPPEKRERTKESPACDDADCKGPHDTQRCTVDPNKDCPCLLRAVAGPPQIPDQDWWEEQQNIIGSVIANPGLITAAPSCFVNGDGNDFNGQPAATPASWCVCDDHGTPRIYPTIDTPSSLCGYSALPTATIAPLVTAAKGETVTSCRIESLIATDTTVGPYCTCNDNFMHKIDTWTDNGSTVTGCIATRTAAAPTSTVDKPTMTTNSQTTVNTPPPMLICNSAGDCTDYDCPDGSKPFCTLTGGDPFTHNCVC